MKHILTIFLIIALTCSNAFAAFGGFLQANTAVDVIVGPFIDDTDGKTAETGLTILAAEVYLSKNGGAGAAKNEGTALSHDQIGNYICKFDTTDTNTEGILSLYTHESGALAVKMEYQVLAQAAYISLMTAKDTGYIGVDVEEVDGTDQTGNDNGADINTIVTAVGNIETDTGTTLDALIKDIPTVAEFEARSIVSADYVVVGDTIAGVTSLTGHTAQTGDNFAIVNGAAGLVAINTDVELILADTGELQVDDYPTSIAAIQTTVDTIEADTEAVDSTTEMRTFLTGADTPVAKDSTPLTAAEAEAEAYDAIELANLDHWMKVVTSNSATMPEVVDDTVLANILTKTDGDTSDYDFTAHSFEAIADASGSSTDVESIMGTALTESTGGNLADNMSTFWDNADSATAKVVDNVGASAAGGGSALVINAGYQGNFKEDSVIAFTWRSIDQGGAAIDPSTAGTIKIYKEDGDTEVTAPTGVTDTRGFDGLTGIHMCKVDIGASAFYARNMNYSAVLTGSVVDSQTTTAVIATFSIEKRYVDEFDR